MASPAFHAPLSGARVRPGQSGPAAEQALSEIMVVEGLGHVDGKEIDLEAFQRLFLMTRARFRCIEKARQTGFSWIFALEATARCHLRDDHTGIFVSYNLGDAMEKIRYARLFAETLPAGFRKKMSEDAKTHVTFEDANGHRSRILSHPSKAPRGKGGDIYLDELAHYQNDDEVYRGSTALIARHPNAQLTICSTPAGRRGIFWQIARQETEVRFEGFTRQRVPWWLSRAYCRDPRQALMDGVGDMATDERIEKWGLPTIHEQRLNIGILDDFRQEFEVEYVDEAYSFYPWEALLAASRDLVLADGFDNWVVRGRLTAGYDVGRRKDLSALTILEEIDGHIFVRYRNTWQNRPFEEQFSTLMSMLDALPIARLSIDQNGIGMQLAEDLRTRYGVRVHPESFTLQNKELWATDLKVLLEQRRITLPRDRELLTQMHSIRRVVIGGKPRFDSEQNARHHGDLYWSLALAAQRERTHVPARVVIRARVI